MNLPRFERHPAIISHNEQAALVVDARRLAATAVRADRLADERVPVTQSREQNARRGDQPASEPFEKTLERPLDLLRRAAQRSGPVTQLGRQRGYIDGHVEADPEDRPAALRSPFDEDARDLAPLDQDIVGPFDLSHRSHLLSHRQPGGER